MSLLQKHKKHKNTRSKTIHQNTCIIEFQLQLGNFILVKPQLGKVSNFKLQVSNLNFSQ